MKLVISNRQLIIKIAAILIILITIYYLPFTGLSKAQVLPEFMITWKANNYAPPEYLGKILPIKNTAVNASMELIDKGKLVNLSPYKVRWFLNDEPLVSGFGMKNANFIVDPFSNKVFSSLRVEIINYRGQNLEKIINIPNIDPKVAVVRINNESFKALPYFLNILTLNQLNFNWSANGIETEGVVENPDMLSIKFITPKTEETINLSLIIQNQKNPLEIINKFMSFQIK